MTIPTPASRDRASDLRKLAKEVVAARLGFVDESLTEHVVETSDLLIPWVERALGVRFPVSWSTISDEELDAVREWHCYCAALFDDVKDYVLNLLRG